MNELKMKAKAGVTLVELLVVILIVTILSVSLLPLLKPYIEEAKYAAEPIPVLANIQTKINLYHYEKDKLPGVDCSSTSTCAVATWQSDANDGVISYNQAFYTLTESGSSNLSTNSWEHFANKVDVDWQDLMGRRMNPSHFSYVNLKGDGSTKYGYAVGVFGDGNGLGKGTGYAVLTIVDTSSTRKVKIVGTWRRYKPTGSDTPVTFAIGGQPSKESDYCHLPDYDTCFGGDVSDLIDALKNGGWEFNEEAVGSGS